MTAVDDGGLQGEEKWQQWVVAVAVYGGGLQGEKTLKSVKKQHVFFCFLHNWGVQKQNKTKRLFYYTVYRVSKNAF